MPQQGLPLPHSYYRKGMADDLSAQIEAYVQKNFPKGVSVPTGVSEDEAIQAVKKQFREAGFDCSDETARGIVHHAWEQNK
jgi:hypothetical protein